MQGTLSAFSKLPCVAASTAAAGSSNGAPHTPLFPRPCRCARLCTARWWPRAPARLSTSGRLRGCSPSRSGASTGVSVCVCVCARVRACGCACLLHADVDEGLRCCCCAPGRQSCWFHPLLCLILRAPRGSAPPCNVASRLAPAQPSHPTPSVHRCRPLPASPQRHQGRGAAPERRPEDRAGAVWCAGHAGVARVHRYKGAGDSKGAAGLGRPLLQRNCAAHVLVFEQGVSIH